MIDVHRIHKNFTMTREQRKKQGKAASTRIQAVKDIGFRCQAGRVFTLLGPNGAGKTTTLRMIATMLRPDEGAIRVAGFDTTRQPQEVRRRLGFLTGATGLYDRLTPAEFVKYFADLHQMDRSRSHRRREELFERLDIHPFARRRIGKLSSGMRQKVSIARTLIHNPEVIVFDEPTAGLDVISAKTIIQLIRELRDLGKTIIFSTHIMGEVSLLSDDLAIIHEGALRYCGTYPDFAANMHCDTLEDEFIRIVEAAT